jgi:hypothetical protein
MDQSERCMFTEHTEEKWQKKKKKKIAETFEKEAQFPNCIDPVVLLTGNIRINRPPQQRIILCIITTRDIFLSCYL